MDQSTILGVRTLGIVDKFCPDGTVSERPGHGGTVRTLWSLMELQQILPPSFLHQVRLYWYQLHMPLARTITHQVNFEARSLYPRPRKFMSLRATVSTGPSRTHLRIRQHVFKVIITDESHSRLG